MKATIILTALLITTIFAFGQRKELKNHGVFGRLIVEQNQNGVDSNDNKIRQSHFIQKNRIYYQKPWLKSSNIIKQKLDSMILWWMDENTNQLVPIIKEKYTYDINENMTQKLDYFWDENTSRLVANMKHVYTYDANGNMTQSHSYNWDETSQWIDDYKETYTYDANGNIILELGYSWDESTSSFAPDEKQEYTYNANGNITQELSYRWDESTSKFVFSWKEEYTYDTNRNITQELAYYWDESFNQWVNVNKSQYTYNANGNMIQSQYYSLDDNTNQLEAIGKTEYTYGANGNIAQSLHSEKDENTGQWVYVGKYDYTFDAYGNMSQELGYGWDESSSQWMYESKFVLICDTSYTLSDLILPYTIFEEDDFISMIKHKMDSFVGYEWDDESDDWSTFLKAVYYYSDQNSTTVNIMDNGTVKVYPNPVSEYLYFKLPGNPDRFNFELFDLLGRKVIDKEVINTAPVNLQSLSKGLYLYNITTNGKKLTGKLIKK